MPNKDDKKIFWLATIGDTPCGSFKTRKEAVKWLKGLLSQELKDFDKQDKTDEYDYNIRLNKIEINKHEEREIYLGL